MNRTEFIIATAVVLFIAFCVGWLTHWVIHRFVRVGQGDMNELDKLAQQLHETEEQRDGYEAHYHELEAQITNQLSQTQAELEAAMDGLRAARQENEELQAYIERINVTEQ